jgi:hypothetical protein
VKALPWITLAACTMLLGAAIAALVSGSVVAAVLAAAAAVGVLCGWGALRTGSRTEDPSS